MKGGRHVLKATGTPQVATADQFISAIEEIVHRKVRAFASATDPDPGVVFEIFSFEPVDGSPDGDGPAI